MAGLKITIVPFEAGGLDLEALETHLAAIFAARTCRGLADFDALAAYDSSRRQHDARTLLDLLAPHEGDRVLGVTTLDLFVPIFTYVFGLAHLSGRAAVVSSFRLDDANSGLPRNPSLLASRLAKEAVHELGHSFGLRHCTDPTCVMASVAHAEEVDYKESIFCDQCLALGMIS